MENEEKFPYPENEYLGWKNARKSGEDGSRKAYIFWRIERDKKSKEFSGNLDKLRKEARVEFDKMSPEEQAILLERQKRHARKVRIEMQGFDQHPEETKEDVFGKKKNKNDDEKK